MKTYKFPSAYKRLATDSFRDTVDFQEKKYLIGEDAVVNGMAIWDIEKLKEVTPLFLKYLRDVRKEDISKVVLSVPSGVFTNAIKRDKQGKKSYFNEVKEIVLNELKEIEDIRFLPQGVSAIYVYMNEDKMKIGDKVLTIDGGFNTLNLALTVVGKPLDIVKNKSMFDKGIRKLLVDYFYPILIDELQMDINEEDYHLLKKLFLSKKIMKGFKTINISNLVEEAVENYIRDLMEEVYKFLMKESIDDYNAINIVGGISYYLKGVIKSDKRLFLPEDNGEFLTAIGMAVKNPGYLAMDLGFGDVKVAKKEG